MRKNKAGAWLYTGLGSAALVMSICLRFLGFGKGYMKIGLLFIEGHDIMDM